jgi:hypothetical protein
MISQGVELQFFATEEDGYRMYEQKLFRSRLCSKIGEF